MAGFTKEQEAFIEKIVFTAAPIFLKAHIDSCPWGQQMKRFIWIGVGIGITLSLLGITTIPALIAALKKM